MPHRQEARGKRQEDVRQGDDVASIASRLSPLACAVKRLFGMPDYASYLRHAAERHPGQEPMTEAEYFSDYLERRYANGPNRCC
jgi:uncharacterized short protein YbdD (DUF466 family)